MSTYHFRVMDAGGRVRHGVRQAASRLALVRELSADGLVLLRLRDRDAGGLRGLLDRDIGPSPRIADPERAALVAELVVLLKAGLRLDQALDLLADAAEQPRAKEAVERALSRLCAGEPLAVALSEPGLGFAAIELQLIAAGERSGAVVEVLAELAEHMERRAAIRSRLMQALLYPALLMAMTVVILGLLVTQLVPRFTPLFEAAGAGLPPLTRMVRDFAQWAADWTLPLTGLAAAAVVALILARRRADVRLLVDGALLRTPWLGGLVRRRAIARLARTLATLLRGGLTLDRALRAAAGIAGNAVLDHSLNAAGDRVAAGQPLWRAIERTGEFPAVTVHMLRIGEESSNLGLMLLRIAEREEGLLARSLERFATLLTPAITLLMGLVVAVVIWAVMSAILGVNALV